MNKSFSSLTLWMMENSNFLSSFSFSSRLSEKKGNFKIYACMLLLLLCSFLSREETRHRLAFSRSFSLFSFSLRTFR